MRVVREDELYHFGIKGMRKGQRRWTNPDGTLNEAGKRRYGIGDGQQSGQTLFVSGSSKTQDKASGYYRRKLPKQVRSELDSSMKNRDKIIVGDAPGVDRQVQKYLKKKHYKDVEVYGPGKEVRYSANKKWKTNAIDDPEHEPMSKEWLAKKDKAMTDASTKGLAVILDEGAQATRNNVRRLVEQNKNVKVMSLSKNGKDWDHLVSGKALVNDMVYNETIQDPELAKVDPKLSSAIDKSVKDAIDEYNKGSTGYSSKYAEIDVPKLGHVSAGFDNDDGVTDRIKRKINMISGAPSEEDLSEAFIKDKNMREWLRDNNDEPLNDDQIRSLVKGTKAGFDIDADSEQGYVSCYLENEKLGDALGGHFVTIDYDFDPVKKKYVPNYRYILIQG